MIHGFVLHRVMSVPVMLWGTLTLLHSKWSKLPNRVLAVLSAIGERVGKKSLRN